MPRATRKHVVSPTEPASDAGFERRNGHLLHTHEAAGSSPGPPTNGDADSVRLPVLPGVLGGIPGGHTQKAPGLTGGLEISAGLCADLHPLSTGRCFRGGVAGVAFYRWRLITLPTT